MGFMEYRLCFINVNGSILAPQTNRETTKVFD